MSSQDDSFASLATQISHLDDATKREVLKVAETHQVQARFQNKVHELTSMCWDKCITTVSGNGFTRGESECLTNCVDRFLDTSMFLVKSLKGEGR